MSLSNTEIVTIITERLKTDKWEFELRRGAKHIHIYDTSNLSVMFSSIRLNIDAALAMGEWLADLRLDGKI